jgi:DNA polymerase-3 subunit gamma/tau
MAPSVMRDLTEEILNSEQVTFDPAVLPLVVRAGAGSARDTLSILDQLLAGSDEGGIRYDRAVALLGYTDASLLDEIVDAFAAADGAAVFRAVNRVIEGGHEPRRFATDMLDRFRDLIVIASVPDAISTGLIEAPPDRVEALRGQAERYGLASLTRAADIVATGLDQMRGATSPRLLLELMCAQVLLPAAATDERSLLARLERLEAGTVAASVPPAAGTSRDYPERMRPAPQPAQSPDGAAAPGGAQPVRPAPAAEQPGPTRPEAQPPTPAKPPQAPLPSGGQGQPGAPGGSGQPGATGGSGQPGATGGSGQAGATGGSGQAGAPGGSGHADGPQGQPPAAQGTPAAPQRPAPAFSHAPGSPGAPAAPSPSPSVPNGTVTIDALRQAWPNVVEAIKSKGRVAAIVIGNASVASFDEGVLTLRFPRQGDVKGFQGSKYEELLKQALTAMFGINVVIRAITGGGDAAPPARRPGPGPGPAAPPAPAQPDYSRPPAPPASSGEGPPSAGTSQPAGPDPAGAAGPQAGAAGNGGGGAAPSFGSQAVTGGDLPPLPPPPPPDDEDFDPDDEGMSVPVTNELTGMALVQRELGAQVIAEYEDLKPARTVLLTVRACPHARPFRRKVSGRRRCRAGQTVGERK